MTLEEAKALVGRRVMYRPVPGLPPEYGTVRRVNEKYAFVEFDTSRQPKACRPDDLERAVLVAGAGDG